MLIANNERQEFDLSSLIVSYSCVIVCAAPQAPENMVNIDNVATIADFRPKTSLSFDQMMIIPRVRKNQTPLVNIRASGDHLCK